MHAVQVFFRVFICQCRCCADSLLYINAQDSRETQQERTLILYVFSNTDPQYYGNLVFFIKNGVPGCDACEYIVIINRGPEDPVRFHFCICLGTRSGFLSTTEWLN